MMPQNRQQRAAAILQIPVNFNTDILAHSMSVHLRGLA